MKARALMIAAVLILTTPAAAQQLFAIGDGQGGPPSEGLRLQRGPGQSGAVATRHRMVTWWKNSEIVGELQLTAQQISEIEQSFNAYRLRLVDASADVQKLDIRLEELINAEHLSEGEISQVLDELVQARGQLSKMFFEMLLSFRRTLLPEQWKKLQTLQAQKGLDMGLGGGTAIMHGSSGQKMIIRRPSAQSQPE